MTAIRKTSIQRHTYSYNTCFFTQTVFPTHIAIHRPLAVRVPSRLSVSSVFRTALASALALPSSTQPNSTGRLSAFPLLPPFILFGCDGGGVVKCRSARRASKSPPPESPGCTSCQCLAYRKICNDELCGTAGRRNATARQRKKMSN